MKFNIEIVCTQEIIMGYVSLIKVCFGSPHLLTSKIVSNNNELIAKKFDREVTYIC